MENFPNEVLCTIFRLLDRKSRKQCNLVCQKWFLCIRTDIKLSSCFKLFVTGENRPFINKFFQNCPVLKSVIVDIGEFNWLRRFDFSECPKLEFLIVSNRFDDNNIRHDLRDFFPQAPRSLCVVKEAVMSPKNIQKLTDETKKKQILNNNQIPNEMKFPSMKIYSLELDKRSLPPAPDAFERLWKLFENQEKIEALEIHISHLELFVDNGFYRILSNIGYRMKKLKFLGFGAGGSNEILEEIVKLCPNITDLEFPDYLFNDLPEFLQSLTKLERYVGSNMDFDQIVKIKSTKIKVTFPHNA